MLWSVKNGLWVVGCGLWAALLLGAAPAQNSFWPEQIGPYKKVAAAPAVPTDQGLFTESGFEHAEEVAYAGGLRGTAYRFKDSTGAFAGYNWLRAENAKGVFQIGNYVIRYSGGAPETEIAKAFIHAPGLDRRPLPSLPAFLPRKDLVPGSERFILGPQGLARTGLPVPPAIAAFDFSTEVEVADYRLPSGPVKLGLFSYPTPQIARKQFPEFQKLPGAVAKQTGLLVAVLFSPKNPDDAERLLAAVRYDGKVTWTEKPPNPRDNVADLLLNIFVLCGILICLFIGAGIVVGLIRRYSGWGKDRDPMIVLRLEK